ncbi:hypothetical protein FACS1894216_13880 [Synergistales bacterium]|nr:hypothetical protein FACS1894216_13880 [Synergistales bacterium]
MPPFLWSWGSFCPAPCLLGRADRNKYYDCFGSFRANDCSPDSLTQLIAAYETEELLKYMERLDY